MINQITGNGKELLLKGKYFLVLIPAKDYSILQIDVSLQRNKTTLSETQSH